MLIALKARLDEGAIGNESCQPLHRRFCAEPIVI